MGAGAGAGEAGEAGSGIYSIDLARFKRFKAGNTHAAVTHHIHKCKVRMAAGAWALSASERVDPRGAI